MRRLALALAAIALAAFLMPAVASAHSGARFIVRCNLVTVGQFDPIVYPGVPAPVGHLHMFFGNRSINPSSTPASLRAAYAYAGGPGTTCELGPNGGDAEDTAAYWAPTLIDTTTGAPILPASDKVYYYNNGDPNVAVPPADAEIIAGNHSALAAQDPNIVNWGCGTGTAISEVNYIPDCRSVAGGALAAHILFPDCFVGGTADPAVTSNYAYHLPGGLCPAGYPVHFAQPVMRLNWTAATSPDPATVRLSSDDPSVPNGAGWSLHADFMNGWIVSQDTTLHAAYPTIPQLRGLNDLVNACLHGNPPPSCSEV